MKSVRIPAQVTFLTTLVLLFAAGCQDRAERQLVEVAKRQTPQAEAAMRGQSETDGVRAECTDTLKARRAEYEKLMVALNYWAASLQLRNCAEALNDSILKALVADAEIKTHLQVLNNPKASAREKLEAAQMLARDYPERGRKYESLVGQLQAQAERQEAAAIAAKKRKAGVRIGMSKDDVLASSWGRPESVNRTTYISGVHEQWVYGGRNYLYFENDKLVSIQN